MATTFNVSPNTNHPAYSTLPVKISGATAATSDYFNYLLSVAYDETDVIYLEPYGLNGAIWTNILVFSGHPFKAGEKILLSGLGVYDGLHTILATPDPTQIIIDVTPTLPFSAVDINPKISHSVNWRLASDSTGTVKLDLSNTLKDFVHSGFKNLGIPYDAASTRFSYKLIAHSEYKWKTDIGEPTNDGGFIAINLTGTDLAHTPLKIGDKIKLDYRMIRADYSDNQFVGGDLGFPVLTGTWPFLVGQTIFVTGQITEQDYNGETTVKAITTSDTMLVTNKAFTTNTPVEPGSIFGHARPEWNAVYTITGIQEVGGDLLVTTNGTYTTALPAGIDAVGTMAFADDVVLQSWSDASTNELNAFTATNHGLFGTNYMNSFVFNGVNGQGNFSTIYQPGTTYRIEKTSLQWLLGHECDTLGSDYMVYDWYDKENNLLGTSTFNFMVWKDTYFPIGVDQVLTSSAVTTTPTFDPNEIVRYEVYPGAPDQQDRTPFLFEVGYDCTTFDIWHLIWRDSNGSFLGYPFKSANIPSIEKEAKSFYNEGFYGKFGSNNFVETSYEGGEREYFSRSREKIELNSGWVNQSELPLIKDLFKSTEVYIQSPSGELKNCKILDTSIPLNNELQDLIQYKLQVSYSQNKYNF